MARRCAALALGRGLAHCPLASHTLATAATGLRRPPSLKRLFQSQDIPSLLRAAGVADAQLVGGSGAPGATPGGATPSPAPGRSEGDPVGGVVERERVKREQEAARMSSLLPLHAFDDRTLEMFEPRVRACSGPREGWAGGDRPTDTYCVRQTDHEPSFVENLQMSAFTGCGVRARARGRLQFR